MFPSFITLFVAPEAVKYHTPLYHALYNDSHSSRKYSIESECLFVPLIKYSCSDLSTINSLSNENNWIVFFQIELLYTLR